MIESLDDLNGQLKVKNGRLYYFYGKPIEIVRKLLHRVDAVFFNND